MKSYIAVTLVEVTTPFSRFTSRLFGHSQHRAIILGHDSDLWRLIAAARLAESYGYKFSTGAQIDVYEVVDGSLFMNPGLLLQAANAESTTYSPIIYSLLKTSEGWSETSRAPRRGTIAPHKWNNRGMTPQSGSNS